MRAISQQLAMARLSYLAPLSGFLFTLYLGYVQVINGDRPAPATTQWITDQGISLALYAGLLLATAVAIFLLAVDPTKSIYFGVLPLLGFGLHTALVINQVIDGFYPSVAVSYCYLLLTAFKQVCLDAGKFIQFWRKANALPMAGAYMVCLGLAYLQRPTSVILDHAAQFGMDYIAYSSIFIVAGMVLLGVALRKQPLPNIVWLTIAPLIFHAFIVAQSALNDGSIAQAGLYAAVFATSVIAYRDYLVKYRGD